MRSLPSLFAYQHLIFAVEDVPADVVLGVVMRRIRPRARHQDGAAHGGVGDIADGLVADAEADAQRRLIAGVGADLPSAARRSAFAFRTDALSDFLFEYFFKIAASRGRRLAAAPLRRALFNEGLDAGMKIVAAVAGAH